MPNLKPSIPYPSRRNDEKQREKDNDQVEKFYKIFQDMSFKISLADALILMPKFASTLKALIENKENKRRSFWSLNKDILKIVILKTNTPYPSKKIRRIRACTHQRPQKDKDQYVCITRSSTNELFTPYKEPEREFRSSRRHFKTLSLDELRSPDFNLLSDQEYSEEGEAKAMAVTMEQYMSKTRTDYGSGVARPKIDNKDQFELKAQFLKELRENTFSGSDNEDANEHIQKVLEIVDLFHVPNIIVDQLML
ncbi:hypothetical protein Tco_1408767 [Tanacetum coccineum]